MDDLDFDKPNWTLHQTLYWIAFGLYPAPAGERQSGDNNSVENEPSVIAFEQAEAELLRKWQEGKIVLWGRKNGRPKPEQIPREDGEVAEFEPLSNAIYVKDRWDLEPIWKDVWCKRDDVQALWPDEGAARKITKLMGRVGRTPGAGSYEQQDEPLMAKLQDLLDKQQAVSIFGAAGLLADKAPGRGTFDSKRRRLARRYPLWIKSR